MNFTWKRIIQRVVAVLIIMVMTLADFSLVGANVISYAIDMVATNSSNVEFSAYFVNSQGEKVTEAQSAIDAEDLKMYAEISVKNEGYFNGAITLGDSSFNISESVSNEYVKSVDSNTVTLNQINAGTTALIELKVSYKYSDEIKAESLNQDNVINLTGTYVSSSKKDVEIKGTTSVKINWTSSEDIEAKLVTKILTNSIYKVNDANKRIVQVLVNSKLNNNLYPVKETNIELNVPAGVEEVKVHSRSTYATNGNENFDENNYQYSEDEGKLKITLKNEEDNDKKINWNKNVKDTLVVTYIYPETTTFEEEKINSNVIIKTYDDKEVKAEEQAIISENIDGIVTNEIIEKESSIYKGKIYTGEERQYTSTTVLNVDYAELVESIEINEQEPKFKTENGTEKTNIQYVETKIEKAKFNQIFGDEGSITILDQDGATIATINSASEVVDGNIVVEYNSGVKAITIKTSKPISNGILDLVHTKAILDSGLSREEIRNIVEIKEEVKRSYNDSESTTNVTKSITLNETSSEANIAINRKTLSTITTNENVEIVATLETNSEAKDLYKNPTVKIIFPSEVEEVNVSKATAVYRNGLTVAKTSQEKNSDGNIVLTVEFEGEQAKYDSSILNGLELHFYTNIVVNKTISSRDVKLKMKYTNENGIEDSYETSTPIHLESKNGLMLYNKVENYNAEKEVIETIDSTEAEATLDIDKKDVTAKVTTALINNYDKDLENVSIIGKLTSVEDIEVLNAIISSVKASDNNAKITYNDDKTEYKITLDTIKSGNTLKLTYDLDIEDKLTANMESNLVTSVSCNYGEKEVTKTSTIVLATEKVVVKEEVEGETTTTSTGLELNIAAVSGNKELKAGDSIYDGETIRYTLTIANNTGTDYENVTIKATQTNGLIFDLVEKEVYNPMVYDGDGMGKENYWEITDKNVKEFTGINIKNGETVTLEYQAVVNGTEGNETYANISITSGDNTELGNVDTNKCKIKNEELKLVFTPDVSEECYWVTDTVQQSNLSVTNTTGSDLSNIEVKITLSKGLDCDKYEDYIEWNSENKVEVEIKNKEKNSLGQTIITLQIAKLSSGVTAEIYVHPYIVEIDEKEGSTEFYATATTESNNTYTSNNIIRKVTQVNKKIEVEQVVKINGTAATTSSIVKDEDTLDFYITVKNKDEEDAKLSIYDYLQFGLNLNSITFIDSDGNKTDITDKYSDTSISYEFELKSGKEAQIVISTKVSAVYMIDKKTIENQVDVTDLETGNTNSASVELSVDTSKYDDGKESNYVFETESDEVGDNQDNQGENTEDPSTNEGENGEGTTSDTQNYTINGYAWIDNDKDGQRDDDEELVQNMEVKAINTETEEVVSTTTTSEEGSYKLTLPEAKYIIVFMYDNDNYYVTTYQANGVSNDVNSDAVTKTLNIDNKDVVAGATDVIELSENKNNIDIGLTYRNKFDLKLEKTVSKIVVTNDSGTKTYDFDDTELAKVEIAAKYLSGSTVVVEYKIKVTNVGDIDGYVKNIVDYMPTDMTFSSTLNKDWYQSEKYLYNESIADQKIAPGESQEVTLILTKTMTESNTGLVNNTAAIKSSYNEKSFSDADTDSDKGSADVIISVKTGVAIRLALLTISLTTIIAVIAYYVTKKYINKKI